MVKSFDQFGSWWTIAAGPVKSKFRPAEVHRLQDPEDVSGHGAHVSVECGNTCIEMEKQLVGSPPTNHNAPSSMSSELAGPSMVSSCIVVVADTESYRNMARSQVACYDHVVEIGSCQGHCTSILHAHAASVIAFDVSLKFLAECRSRFPDIRFEFLDIFEEHDRLANTP